ncbi:MAG: hypothetical protein FWC72_04770 [Oscillospiraceae bacterium]|nr:hypothetical protein [Oscillospiraceae bacterium]
MKKITATLLVLLILFTAACVSGDTAPPTPEPTPEPTVAPTPEPTVAPVETEPPSSDGEISAAEILELQSDARWIFEQRLLPSVVFEFHGEIIDFLNDFDAEGMEMILLWAWEYVASVMAEYELGDRISLFDNYDERLLDAIGLGDEHIAEVAIEQLSEDVVGAIVKMLNIDQPQRSTHIGIVYSEDSGLRVFTLEQSFDDIYVLCFVDVEGRGSFFQIENDRDAFIEAILEVLETQIEPAGGQFWSRW